MYRKVAAITFFVFATIIICYPADNNKVTLFCYSSPSSYQYLYEYVSVREPEDYCVIQDDKPNEFIAAVFDGHGGASVAQHLEKNWIPVLKAEIEKTQANIVNGHNLEDAFKNACNTVDRQVQYMRSGSTLCSVMIQDNIAHIANVGDSRLIVINTDGSIEFFTEDHTADNPKENDRLTKLSANIIQDQEEKRIYFKNGNIRPSRAIGDYNIDSTSIILTSDPDYFKLKLAPENLAIVIATDGLWDIFNNKEVAQKVFEKNTKGERNIAELLCYLARCHGSEDDITVIVKYLQ